MDTINAIAWALVLLSAAWWAWLRFQCWRADRRIRQIRDEVVSIAREIGIAESALTCPHGIVVGDECRICDRV